MTGDAPLSEQTRTRTNVGKRSHATTAPIAPAEQIARFSILGKLGQGGMGQVYMAYDPQLRRRVAVKVLRFGDDEHSTGQHERLVREARALAQVTHPNVVRIHDVGVVDGQVFIAMEMISGVSLRRWMEEHPPGSQTHAEHALDLLTQAGRGLAAAHRAGIVHRDFKPSNVMVGLDGRVRVVDFGLARPFGEEELTDSTRAETDHSRRDDNNGDNTPRLTPEQLDRVSATLTRPGSLLGTPSYMPPERFRGINGDPRSDQFSFCVTAFECLFGARPFSGRTPLALLEAIEQRAFVEVTNPAISARVRTTIERGLHPSRQRRFDSIDELLKHLRRPPIARQLALASVLATLGGAAIGWAALGGGTTTDPGGPQCDEGATEVAAVWNDSVRADIERAAVATEQPYAADVIGNVLTTFDGYTEQWADMRDATCRATWLDESQTQEVLEVRMHCLDGHLQRINALAEALARVDESNIETAGSAIGDLPDLAYCEDASALLAVTPLPSEPDDRRTLTALEDRLAKLGAWPARSNADALLHEADALVAAADTLGYVPLHASTLDMKSQLLQNVGNDLEGAVQARDEAFWLAIEAGDDRAATQISAKQSGLLSRLDRITDSERWLGFARDLEARIGQAPSTATHIAYAAATLERKKGNEQRALAAAEQALEFQQALKPPDLQSIAGSQQLVASSLHRLGRTDEALEVYEKSLTLYREAVGPRHPWFGGSLMNKGIMHNSVGQYAEALAAYAQARPLLEALQGPDHADMGSWWLNVGVVHSRAGRFEDARAAAQRALEITEAAYGPHHSKVARAITNLASATLRLGQPEQALELFVRALEINEARLGPDHPDLGHTLQGIAEINLELGHIDEAAAANARAKKVRSRGGELRFLGNTLGIEGRLHEHRGHLPAALEAFQHSLEVRQDQHVTPDGLLLARSDIARVLVKLGRPSEALAMAKEALREATHAENLAASHLVDARFTIARALWMLDRDHMEALALAEWAQANADSRQQAELLASIERWCSERDGWMSGP